MAAANVAPLCPGPGSRLIGLTGGIASGKSLALALLRECGAVTFSADEAAGTVMAPGSSVLAALASAFGREVLCADGSLNRAALGRRVFADPEELKRLDRITHPPILRLLRAQVEGACFDLRRSTVVTVEVPLLFEVRLEGWFQRVVVVTATEEMRLARLCSRSGLPRRDAQRRLLSQMPLELKEARADVVLRNEGTVSDLNRQIEALVAQIASE